MSKRDIKLLLEDILESINRIEEYTLQMEFDDFTNNQLVFDGVVRNLEIIGEASTKIPTEFKEKTKNIPWREIRGLRNRIIHEYFGIDISIVWYIIKQELPQFKIEIQKAITS